MELCACSAESSRPVFQVLRAHKSATGNASEPPTSAPARRRSVKEGRKTRRWGFIYAHRAEFSVQQLCRVLGTSRSGYCNVTVDCHARFRGSRRPTGVRATRPSTFRWILVVVLGHGDRHLFTPGGGGPSLTICRTELVTDAIEMAVHTRGGDFGGTIFRGVPRITLHCSRFRQNMPSLWGPSESRSGRVALRQCFRRVVLPRTQEGMASWTELDVKVAVTAGAVRVALVLQSTSPPFRPWISHPGGVCTTTDRVVDTVGSREIGCPRRRATSVEGQPHPLRPTGGIPTPASPQGMSSASASSSRR